MRKALRLLALLDALATATVAGAGSSNAVEPAVDPQSVFAFLPTEHTILSPEDAQVIGHGRFTVTAVGDAVVIEGRNEYLDGRRDHEIERLGVRAPGEAPVLLSSEHWYFGADGKPRRVHRLDARSGEASCAVHEGGGAPEVRRTTLAVPSDTYAGAARLLLVVGRLRQGQRERIRLHSFQCMPGPRILPIEVSVAGERERWPMYPGQLARAEIEPDLGLVGILIAPFVPRMEIWFDPQHDWNYVGAVYDRHYKGEHILTVRKWRGSVSAE